MQISGRGVQRVYEGEVKLRDTTGNLKTAQRSHVVGLLFPGAKNRTTEVEVEQQETVRFS